METLAQGPGHLGVGWGSLVQEVFIRNCLEDWMVGMRIRLSVQIHCCWIKQGSVDNRALVMVLMRHLENWLRL